MSLIQDEDGQWHEDAELSEMPPGFGSMEGGPFRDAMLYDTFQGECVKAIRMIANGHQNPQALAKHIVADYEAGTSVPLLPGPTP